MNAHVAVTCRVPTQRSTEITTASCLQQFGKQCIDRITGKHQVAVSQRRRLIHHHLPTKRADQTLHAGWPHEWKTCMQMSRQRCSARAQGAGSRLTSCPPPPPPPPPASRLPVSFTPMACCLMARSRHVQAVGSSAAQRSAKPQRSQPCAPIATPRPAAQTVRRGRRAQWQRVTASRGTDALTVQPPQQASTQETSLTQTMFERMQAATRGGGQGMNASNNALHTSR